MCDIMPNDYVSLLCMSVCHYIVCHFALCDQGECHYSVYRYAVSSFCVVVAKIWFSKLVCFINEPTVVNVKCTDQLCG